jgi:hypothetical protein
MVPPGAVQVSVERSRRRRGVPIRVSPVVIAVTLGLLAVSVVFVAVTNMRPQYDAYGWLVWGRQVLHWNLNTNGAPSWKPLPFLFTVPYALAGHAQMWLWMVTAVAGAFGGAVFAARIAFRLAGPCPGRRYAPYVAAALAGAAVLGLGNYPGLVLIANSDPLIVTLCLAAIDAHLSGRPRLAFAALVLGALGRPEVWLFTAGYAAYAWRSVPKMRILTVIGLFVIPLLWFGIPALTAKSWFISGDLALNSRNMIHGSKIAGVINRLLGLYGLQMQLAVGLAMVWVAVRRDRAMLSLVALAWLWVVVEIAFAFHGWSAVPRYLIEPAAVLVVVAAAGVGQLLAARPEVEWLRWVELVAPIVLLAALIPAAQNRVNATRYEVTIGHHAAKQMGRLEQVIKQLGGAHRIRSCGQPVTIVGLQSALAWELGMNVGYVGYKPGRSIQKGLPIVLFKPHGLGWEIRPIHSRAADITSCATLKADTDFG